jgi:acetamidase/formamidase
MEPVLSIKCGDTVTIDTVSGAPHNLPQSGPFVTLDDHLEILTKCRRGLGPHLLTGPIFVEGCAPGDRLIVKIKEVRPRQNWGWNAIEPDAGLFPKIADHYENLIVPIDLTGKVASLPWGPKVALEPFFGVLAVAPARCMGALTSVVPGAFGGNIDNRFCRAGSELHLPAMCEGALFSVGDGHALQGDGEVCDTALETALSGDFEFDLIKNSAPAAPEIYFSQKMITMAFDEDLDTAVSTACGRMINNLMERFDLSRKDAYRHCSLLASLRVTQVVNGKKGVHCIVDTRLLEQFTATIGFVAKTGFQVND